MKREYLNPAGCWGSGVLLVIQIREYFLYWSEPLCLSIFPSVWADACW